MTTEQELIRKWRLHVFESCADRIGRFVETYPDRRQLRLSFEQCGTDYRFVAPLLNDPDRTFRAGRKALDAFIENDLGVKPTATFDPDDRIYFRIDGIPESVQYPLGSLGADHVGRLVRVDGTVETVGERRPVVVSAAFHCERCGSQTVRSQRNRRLRYPSYCSHCRNSGTFTFEPNESSYVDSQRIQLTQDSRSIPVLLEHDLVSRVTPGDEIRVTAIPRARKRDETTRLDLELEPISVEGVSDATGHD